MASGQQLRRLQQRSGVLAISITLLQTCVTAWADDAAQSAVPARADSATTSMQAQLTAADSIKLPLDDVQDIAYCLLRIRQQITNIYIESTRKHVPEFFADVQEPSSIPSGPLEDTSSYLPLRKAWLVFFIGATEPLVHLLKEDLKSIHSITIPAEKQTKWQTMVHDWDTQVSGVTDDLGQCTAMLDEPEVINTNVAKLAKSMDVRISRLTTMLHHDCKFMSQLSTTVK